jgi:hypothetical protein
MVQITPSLHQPITSDKNKKMSNLLYLIAIILVIIWAAGFFAFHLGSVIHILLVIALIAILLRIIKGRNPI